MYEIGRLCVKLAGRDARKKCVIIDILKDNYVLIDGQTRRRKCNIAHLEPLNKVLKVKKNASHSEVKAILKKEGVEVIDTKPKHKKEKPKKVKKAKVIKEEETKEKEKIEKKTVKPKKVIKDKKK